MFIKYGISLFITTVIVMIIGQTLIKPIFFLKKTWCITVIICIIYALLSFVIIETKYPIVSGILIGAVGGIIQLLFAVKDQSEQI